MNTIILRQILTAIVLLHMCACGDTQALGIPYLLTE